MNKIIKISLLLLSLLPLTVKAVSIQQADSAYTADRFQEAVNAYQDIINNEGTSATLLYNLGNCYYRLGEYGEAILNYERALRLDPTFEDARQNLEFVNSKITDRPGERGSFIGNALDAAALTAKSDVWAWLSLSFFTLTLLGIIAYIFSDAVLVRKLGFFGGFVSVILTAIFIFLSLRSASIANADDKAIVTASSTILSTSPREPKDRSQEAMLLHEGTKVTILDSVRSTSDSIPTLWYDVEIDNTHRAWINAAAVEKI